jgi:hypothetical protein
MTMARFIKKYKLNEDAKLSVKGRVRKMEKKDSKVCHTMLMEYLSSFKMHQNMSLKEFQHLCVPKENGVVHSFVICDYEKENEILDFFSFYALPTQVLNKPEHQELNVSLYFE